MVAVVEEMVVECSMKPVVEELNRACMKQSCDYDAIVSPKWQVSSQWKCHVACVKYYPIEQYLVIPVHHHVYR